MATDRDSECRYDANLADFNVMRVIIIVIVIRIIVIKIVYNSKKSNNSHNNKIIVIKLKIVNFIVIMVIK